MEREGEKMPVSTAMRGDDSRRTPCAAPAPFSIFSAVTAWALLVCLACQTGCSSSSVTLVTVEGRVTLDGEPLEAAIVRFIPVVTEDGISVRPSSGKTDADGRYVLAYSTTQSGIRPGTYQVQITTYVPPVPEVAPVVPERVPDVYNGASTLTAEVTEKKSTFDFELTSDAGKVKQPFYR